LMLVWTLTSACAYPISRKLAINATKIEKSRDTMTTRRGENG
jgi:hypothetical protein